MSKRSKGKPEVTVDLVNKDGEKRQARVTAQLIGADGNIFNLVAIAQRALRRAGLADSAAKMWSEVQASHSYEEALHIIGKYVDIE